MIFPKVKTNVHLHPIAKDSFKINRCVICNIHKKVKWFVTYRLGNHAVCNSCLKTKTNTRSRVYNFINSGYQRMRISQRKWGFTISDSKRYSKKCPKHKPNAMA